MHSLSNRCETTSIPSLPDYAFGEKLGAGSYGTVYKARLISSIHSRPSSAVCSRPTSAVSLPPVFFAIKCINRKSLTKVTQDLLLNEIKILKEIKHENIVEMHDFRWDENYIYIIMEYCAGGDLSMFIRSRQQLSEARARPFVKQIAKVIKFLNEKNISHMDLKPENILLTSTDRPILKVADFGVAQHIGKHGSQSIRGTLMYMAPEILSSEPYDNRVDLWSIGVILYECLFGRLPFSFQTVPELVDKIKANTAIEIPNDARLSPECRHLLQGLLQRDPNKRLSFQEFFLHPFIFNDYSLQIMHADSILQQANEYEKSGDLQKALNLHVQALDEYLAIIKIDEDPDRRQILRTIVQKGVRVAEDLKRRIKEATTNPGPLSSSPTASTTNSSIPSPTITLNENLDVKNDKELFNAYQHCLNGNQFMNSFAFQQAYEEYEKGLEVLFRTAPTETDPAKKTILREMITHYLSKAESCKQRCEAQQIDLAIEKIKNDSEKDTSSLQDTTRDELKHRSTPTSTCLIQ